MEATRETAKNDYIDIMNFYRGKINDLLGKKIDFTISFEGQKNERDKIVKVK